MAQLPNNIIKMLEVKWRRYKKLARDTLFKLAGL
jgi:hypothetical protein